MKGWRFPFCFRFAAPLGPNLPKVRESLAFLLYFHLALIKRFAHTMITSLVRPIPPTQLFISTSHLSPRYSQISPKNLH